ncbi:hypothetical protein CISG_03016 [Coccidioides immitis RMSCC 3703]|uniref:Uncharacterized protein n=1 Tax=Coccidioides immitis RMSCC 3703 TaxID=454286 RepID=A0A0J8QMD4_COCIT|nr:hypothetical protein CISG_03016 [Coccidioides immitis RMSCC 3703]
MAVLGRDVGPSQTGGDLGVTKSVTGDSGGAPESKLYDKSPVAWRILQMLALLGVKQLVTMQGDWRAVFTGPAVTTDHTEYPRAFSKIVTSPGDWYWKMTEGAQLNTVESKNGREDGKTELHCLAT